MDKSRTSDSAIKKAADLLKQGYLVAFPTETVYGLGADASNDQALARLYAAKGRPGDHPVIVHLSDMAKITQWAIDIPDEAYKLAETFVPGPLTFILKRARHVSDRVTGGQNTVGLRIPSHPIALDLLREFGGGVAAPSANKFGKLSPTCAVDVADSFGDEVSMVLDGGPCDVGIESTIVDLTGAVARILRPGMITKSALQSVLGIEVLEPAGKERQSPDNSVRVPGGLPSHYAPNTPLQIVTSEELGRFAHGPRPKMAVLSFQPMPPGYESKLWISLPRDPAQYARQLYSSLRLLDSHQATNILIEAVPGEPDWTGIRDRISRAAQR
jgi:L-threonylcarbamoyladenylate synthase